MGVVHLHARDGGSEQRRFFQLLDPNATQFTFQIFDDSKQNKVLPRHFCASVDDPALDELHAQGAGIYVTVNETDLAGRSIDHIKRIRAVWVEYDGGGDPREFITRLPISPSLIVETSPGHYHFYFL